MKVPLKNTSVWGAWVASSIKLLTVAEVVISRLLSSSPTSGSVLTARSRKPASDSVSPSLCSSPPHALSLSLKNKSTLKKIKKKKRIPPSGIPSSLFQDRSMSFSSAFSIDQRGAGLLTLCRLFFPYKYICNERTWRERKKREKAGSCSGLSCIIFEPVVDKIP